MLLPVKIFWAVIIFIAPVIGLISYLVIGLQKRKKLLEIDKQKIWLLYLSCKKNGVYTTPVKLPAQINSAEFWTFGPSVNFKQPGYLYFSSHLAQGMGRTDIYRVKYTVKWY